MTMIVHGSSIPVGSRPNPELGGIAPRVEAGSCRWPSIDVCICTYYRTTVLDALRGVAAQSVRSEIPIRVVIADNAPYVEAQSRVLAAAREFDLDMLYVHAPANKHIHRA